MIQPAILRRRRAFLALTGRLALAAGCAPLSWAAGANPRIRAPKKKLLLDTDIGSDIDDAVALAYIVMQPDIDLLGITTATGESVKRAALARQITRQVGLDIPGYPGSRTSSCHCAASARCAASDRTTASSTPNVTAGP